MNNSDFWCDQFNNPREVEKQIEEYLDKRYPNPYEQNYYHIECPNCGKSLYDGDIYYPQIYACQYCLKDYEVRVELD